MLVLPSPLVLFALALVVALLFTVIFVAARAEHAARRGIIAGIRARGGRSVPTCGALLMGDYDGCDLPAGHDPAEGHTTRYNGPRRGLLRGTKMRPGEVAVLVGSALPILALVGLALLSAVACGGVTPAAVSAGVTPAAVSAGAKTCSDAVGSPAAVSAERFACDAMGAAFGSAAGATCKAAISGVGVLCSDVPAFVALVPASTTQGAAAVAPDYRDAALHVVAARGAK